LQINSSLRKTFLFEEKSKHPGYEPFFRVGPLFAQIDQNIFPLFLAKCGHFIPNLMLNLYLFAEFSLLFTF
jgi:hypothetical protein